MGEEELKLVAVIDEYKKNPRQRKELAEQVDAILSEVKNSTESLKKAILFLSLCEGGE